MPVLSQFSTMNDEGDFIAKELLALNSAGYAWRDMAVLYRAKFIGERIVQRLRNNAVPVEWLGEVAVRKKFDPADDNVKVMTIHKSKGLEFPIVAIAGVGYLPMKDLEPKEEAKLLYVGMTRAMEMLLMTAHIETEFVKRLQFARSSVATAQGQGIGQ
jgi:superfamily I DNA/RNA helicase